MYSGIFLHNTVDILAHIAGCNAPQSYLKTNLWCKKEHCSIYLAMDITLLHISILSIVSPFSYYSKTECEKMHDQKTGLLQMITTFISRDLFYISIFCDI